MKLNMVSILFVFILSTNLYLGAMSNILSRISPQDILNATDDELEVMFFGSPIEPITLDEVKNRLAKLNTWINPIADDLRRKKLNISHHQRIINDSTYAQQIFKRLSSVYMWKNINDFIADSKVFVEIENPQYEATKKVYNLMITKKEKLNALKRKLQMPSQDVRLGREY